MAEGISVNEFLTQQQRLSDLVDKTNKSFYNIMSDQQRSAEQIRKENEASTDKQLKTEERVKKEIRDKEEEAHEKRMKSLANTMSSIGNSMNSLLGNFESMLNRYTEEQQKLAYNLLGTGLTYNDIKATMSVLGTNAFVKQNEVYSNLTQLVSSGITMNAAQRAFLQTASNQVNLGFQANSDALNRLIQLQQTDLSEARVAQMHGLKEFLEQNYQNSQYIQQGFSQVSDALLEMQSLMSAQVAMSTEKTIQTYLGSFTSAGGSNAGNIAQALGAIGSGDFSGLNEGMQNLMVMAASRAGLSYADLLTGGLDANKSEQLMASLFSYIASMNGAGGGSNVAMSAMAKIFGVSVSDIRAASQMGSVNVNRVNDSIAGFLGSLANATNMSTRLSNILNNLQSEAAVQTSKVSYDLGKFAANTLGNLLLESDIGVDFGLQADLGGIIGSGVKMLPALNVLSQMASIAGSDLSIGNAFSSIFSKESASKLISGGIKNAPQSLADILIEGMFAGMGLDAGGLLRDYEALGNGGMWRSGSGQSFSATGSFSGGIGGLSRSGKITNQELSYNTVEINGTEEDFVEHKTLDDLYNLLNDDFPNLNWSTVANIASANNSVLLGDAHTTEYITDMITLTAVSAENILILLENFLGNGSREMINIGSLGLKNSYGDWSGVPQVE